MLRMRALNGVLSGLSTDNHSTGRLTFSLKFSPTGLTHRQMKNRPAFDYDVAVIGGGSAGYAAAKTAADAGLKTVIIESAHELGGLCILRGCMPSKALARMNWRARFFAAGRSRMNCQSQGNTAISACSRGTHR